MASVPGPASMAENTKPKKTGYNNRRDRTTGEEGSSTFQPESSSTINSRGGGGGGGGGKGRRSSNNNRGGRGGRGGRGSWGGRGGRGGGCNNSPNNKGKQPSTNQDEGIAEIFSSQNDDGVQVSQPRHIISVDPSRVVKRPVTRGRSEFISQVLRRFECRGQVADTEITVSMSPSDPDFPYDIKQLVFKLSVPTTYPESLNALPSIKVINEDIPMGFRTNIERGFDSLATRREDATLLDLLNSLDKCLEGFLATERVETLKIVRNTSQPTSLQPSRSQTPLTTAQPLKPSPPPLMAFPVDNSTPEEASAAGSRREREIHRLEARMRGSSVFRKSEDGTRYTIPMEPRKRYQLPVPLQKVDSVVLIVPLSYNINRPWLEFPGVPEDVVKRVNNGFAKQVQKNPKFSLMENINALCSNLHILSTQDEEEEEEDSSEKQDEKRVEEAIQSLEGLAVDSTTTTVPSTDKSAGLVLDDKAHVQVIPRPPDWNVPEDGESDDNDDDSEYDSDDYVSDDPVPDRGEGAGAGETSGEQVDHQKVIERGTSMSIPGIDMPGVQLLEVAKLNAIVKCTKCKKELEVNDLKPTMPGKTSKPKLSQCEKCSQVLGIGFRQEFVHMSSSRLGFFDLAGCAIVEILPSDFIPQCASCSTSLPPPGIKGLVPGQRQSTNCRECHAKMSIFIPEIKLLRITFEDEASAELASRVANNKKSTERERYVIGHELPFQGRCAHYKKSTRWFRFSCCNKVFPCDKCHDEQVEPSHPWEHANRMICGTCSREQQYRPEECAYCRHAFIKRYTGYWEGGTGTRDKRLLRRNDPRKHKRVGKAIL